MAFIKNYKRNKSILFFSMVALAAMFLTGCGSKDVDMNELGSNGKYNYRNADLGFSIELPKEFIYYQTQRKTVAEHSDIEFYVPTADPKYIDAEFPSYAKPVVVSIFTKTAWDKTGGREIVGKKVREKDDKVYLLRFWDSFPSDWKGKWNQEMQDEITKSFKTE